MKYTKIWDKVLSPDEKIGYEFSIGGRYLKVGIILWGFLSLLLLRLAGLGVVTFLVALFYYGYYLKEANAYAFTNKRVLIHRGWLSTHTISVDYEKITDVHITEAFLEKIVSHSGDISIITAGSTMDQIKMRHVEFPYEVKKKLDSLKDMK